MTPKIKKIIVFYLHIDNMPKSEIEPYIKEKKDLWEKYIGNSLDESVKMVLVPVKDRGTGFEVLNVET